MVFPATLLGSDQKWTSLNNLSTTEYLNYEGGKFSKSRNLGIFGHHVQEEGLYLLGLVWFVSIDFSVEKGLAPHVWRFYLLATRPETIDADFQWEDFVAKNNNEFVANPGNFVFRVLNILKKGFFFLFFVVCFLVLIFSLL